MDFYMGEIIMGGWNFAPSGTAFCHGQIMSISQNSAVFALLGTTFGGNGTQTFGLPDMRGRVPMGSGQGNGLSNQVLGRMAGTESVTLTVAQMPAHSHAVNIGSSQAISDTATGRVLATQTKGGDIPEIYTDTPVSTLLRDDSISQTGGNQPHSNMQPYLCVSFVIVLQGIFPSRN
jgi:microcystin-dependent protein